MNRLLAGLLVLLALAPAATAQPERRVASAARSHAATPATPLGGSSYQLAHAVVSGGAFSGLSSGYRLDATLSQVAVGEGGGPSYTLGSGFWRLDLPESAGGGTPPLAVVPDATLVYPGQTLQVEIVAGSETSPVAGLFGLSFVFTYDPAVFSFDPADLALGSFLDTGTGGDVLLFTDASQPGEVAVAVTRTHPLPGVDGHGPVVTLALTVLGGDGPTTLGLSDVFANDSGGAEIALTPVPAVLQTLDIPPVWPGDTDNDGTVDAADLLPIGAYFGLTGPARLPEYDPTWEAQPAPPWDPVEATYADASGDGEVDQQDVLPLGLNYGRTHGDGLHPGSERLAGEAGTSSKGGDEPLGTFTIEPAPVGSLVSVALRVGSPEAPVDSLLGVAALWALPHAVLDLADLEPGAWLDDGDLLRFHVYDAGTGTLDAAFTRKNGAPFAEGHGPVMVLGMEVVAEMTEPATLTLWTAEASGSAGGPRPLGPDDVVIETAQPTPIDPAEPGLPTAYALLPSYPNPFGRAGTTLRYDLPEPAAVRLEVFDVLGRRIATLVDEDQAAGRHEARFETPGFSSGTYAYRLVAEGSQTFTRTERMTLLR